MAVNTPAAPSVNALDPNVTLFDLPESYSTIFVESNADTSSDSVSVMVPLAITYVAVFRVGAVLSLLDIVAFSVAVLGLFQMSVTPVRLDIYHARVTVTLKGCLLGAC